MSDQTANEGPLHALENAEEFIARHIGPGEEDIRRMLQTVGAPSLDDLTESTLPPAIQQREALDLAPARSEHATLARLRELAQENQLRHNMIGLGYAETITPPVIQRNVLENPGWYTAYTPYQAEISQGRLEALLNFQTMITDLTGMELANASLLDEATAAAEAMAQLKRINRRNKSPRFLVDAQVLPQTLDVLRIRAEHFGFEIVVGEAAELLAAGDAFGMLLQYPGAQGEVRDLEPLIAQAAAQNTLTVVAADLLSLVLLKAPGAMGADIVVGSSQRFGVPLCFGGPHAAFYATRDAHKRTMPGRVIGVSVDRHGKPALRMALQTREQHIRRDKATSNICTAQALLAVMASMYAVYHGPGGLQRIARRIHRQTQLLADGLGTLGYALRHASYFDTLCVETGTQTDALLAAADAAGINLRRVDENTLGISVGESTTREHLNALFAVFCGPQQSCPELGALDRQLDAHAQALPDELQRSGALLAHDIFRIHHSETEMLRYLKRLENRDLSLAHAMIPLGSCTMKLNATTEMVPVTWPEFAQIHPFAPDSQVQGYRKMIAELERMLVVCTGYDAVSLQPNAGSQGEYAGLLAIRGYHDARGDQHRNICLIPSSAHGTNPASAAMAGMKIVVVKCDDNGNVDVDELRAKAEEYSDQLAALMITYPSTHGVYEEQVRDICDLIHAHGGQVYLDGANLNALVGLAGPGQFGADCSHLNLHKTFCIPHGGGGPGVGPLCCGEHLAPYLPGHGLVDLGGTHARNHAVAAAPFGSAGILPISWAYITMMGPAGMKKATQVAILSANYIARRLEGAYDVLYTGRNGRVAHECIIDLRPFKQQCGISEEDVAKRLIDYGFHAPTMSFPVPGTLMIEPTESESLAELDRFCEAMLAIREEIKAVNDGRWPEDDNPLVNAPHNATDLIRNWEHPYDRGSALFPTQASWNAKFWPFVARVDNVHGDRNLVCSCPPLDVWMDEDAA